MVESAPLKRVLILGAGFGGLRAAFLLSRKLRRAHLLDRYEVVLIDRNEHHTYTPLLYEVATTSKETANIHELHNIATYNIRGTLKGMGVKFIQAEVTLVDVREGDVHFIACPSGKRSMSEERLKADYLILALGAEANFYGIPGLKEHALPFKTMTDAVRIRDVIYGLAMEGVRDVRVVVGGGGPTGVELAGELKEWCGELTDKMKCNLDVTIIHSAPTILPGMDPRVIRLAETRLKKFGVKVLVNKLISAATEHEVALGDERIPYDILIWAGGVKASSLLTQMPLKMEPRGRAEAGSRMECLPQTPDLNFYCKIYGIGDSMCFYHPKTKEPVPGVARAALSQARIAAHNIFADIEADEGRGPARHMTYRPMNYPYITPVGGKYAIAKIGPFVVSGFAGWLLKGIVELSYLLSILPLGKAFIVWVTGLYVFTQNDRLG